MENKTIVTAAVATVVAGAIAATMTFAPITNEQTIMPDPTPTATIEVAVSPTPTVIPTPTPTPSASITPTATPKVTTTPKTTNTPTPNASHTPTLEDYAIRTVLEDGTVVVTYPEDMPPELVIQLMPKPKGATK